MSWKISSISFGLGTPYEMAPWAYMVSPSAMLLSARRAKLSYRTMPIHLSAHPNSRIMRIGIWTKLLATSL